MSHSEKFSLWTPEGESAKEFKRIVSIPDEYRRLLAEKKAKEKTIDRVDAEIAATPSLARERELRNHVDALRFIERRIAELEAEVKNAW